MPSYEILAPASVVRALDELSDADYDLVAEAIVSLAENPFPSHATKLRMRNARIQLSDGSSLKGPFLRIRARATDGGKSGGFRIIYVVDTAKQRICLAKVARRGDDTYKDLEQVLKRGRIAPLHSE